MKRSTATLLALAIVALIVADGADFFFHEPFYEAWDSAANSLDIMRAKHFAALYGCYSRWGFHHPGPAFFYVQAFGEWLFYDWLRAVPAPFNGQTLAHLALMAGFYVATLRVFARWLPEGRGRRPALVLAALGLGLWHFTAVAGMPSYDVLRGPSVFTSMWPAHALVLPFACLMAAAASVAAGRAGDLPLLATVGGFLVHSAVAQPLFVVPFTMLAVAGMLWNHRGRWRETRGPLLWALGIVLFFASPVFVDLLQGPDSNLSAILQHLRSHRGEAHKTWGQSAYYFLQFAGAAPVVAGEIELNGAGPGGVGGYAWKHAGALSLWLGILALAFVPLIEKTRRGWHRPPEIPAWDDVAGAAARVACGRFLGWSGIFLGLALALTFFWGTIQDGQMFYYNAWFNFGILHFAALTATAGMLARVRDVGNRGLGTALLAGGTALLLASGFVLAGRWRVRDPEPEITRLRHDAVARVLADRGDSPGALRALVFPTDAWPTVAGVALQLARAGVPFTVPGGWEVFFGADHAWDAAPAAAFRQPGGSVQRWNFSLNGEFLDPGVKDPTSIPLGNDVALSFVVPNFPPAGPDGASEISFLPDGNAQRYVFGGWSGAEPWGTWSETHRAVLGWRGSPVAGDRVEVTVEADPFLAPESGLSSQRMRVWFNGQPLGPECRVATAEGGKVTFTIPAETWNRSTTASLEFDFPDAIAPVKLDRTGENRDARRLAFGFHRVRFQTGLTTAPLSTR